MINRKELVQRHNPILTQVDIESPMAVGNGEFAFTADVTGFQSLYSQYINANAPLCTMSQWGWHTEPAPNASGQYTLSDVDMTRYDFDSYSVEYAVECKPGNEEVYNWLRHNPHRLNLAKISLTWNDNEILSSDLSNIKQELDLFTGALRSDFKISGNPVHVQTVCAKTSGVVGFSIKSDSLPSGALKVEISFPYGSHSMSASDWHNTERHSTDVIKNGNGALSLKRTLDRDMYFVGISGDANISRAGAHAFTMQSSDGELSFTVSFSQDEQTQSIDFDEVYKNCADGWAQFWQSGGAVDFGRSKDPRAAELERRTVLSQYLTAIHCSGSLPPQETGLACNSWYGKFHLEMHILHAGWFPLWGRSELLEKSFDWYLGILDNARKNAARNGYQGARWPKMTGPAGIDCPSRIATLLIWQQPHILYMLELALKSKPETQRADFMNKYWGIIRETADFMVSFAKLNGETGKYDLPAPLIPAQEEHEPRITKNPTFELSYWRFGLELAVTWATQLGENYSSWENVLKNLADLPISNGLYAAHENCPDTFESFNRDHPSMLYAFGFIPCACIDEQIMSDTLDKVMEQWDFNTTWGWDFALMAMTLTRLEKPEKAVDALLMDTVKNSYVASGNNYQKSRTDLPLYLPGNGSLLLALSMMIAGYGEKRDTPGFFKNGMWNIEYEGILPLPY